jgi:hypothetical protein
MKRVIAGTFMATVFAVGLSAQTTPPQSQPPQSQPAQESKDAAKNVTVTGCLKAGDTPESFMLSDLKWGSDKAVGTAGSPAPAISATSLKLVGSPSSGKLADHIGHTIEVSGSIEKGDKAPSAAADPAAKPPASSSSTPSLNVRNVRMVAATCQAQ